MATIEERTNTNGEKVFRIRVSCGYTPDGKQIVRSETWKPDANLSSREIKRALDRQVFQMEEKYAKTSATFRRIKFAELAEEWLESAALSQTLRISTLERMKGCRERAYAAIGNCYVDMLDYRTIQSFIFSLAGEGVNKTTGKGLSEKTQKHYLTFISDVMKYAMLCGIIDRNPCQGVPVVKTVSAILGHSQTSTTMDIYAHSFQEANAQALDDIAKLFKRKPNDSSP